MNSDVIDLTIINDPAVHVQPLARPTGRQVIELLLTDLDLDIERCSSGLAAIGVEDGRSFAKLKNLPKDLQDELLLKLSDKGGWTLLEVQQLKGYLRMDTCRG